MRYDLGKLPLTKPPHAFTDHLIEDSGLHFQKLQTKAIFMLSKLPQIHRAPFHRLLIATALVNAWELATVDKAMDAYSVQTVGL